VFRWTRQDDTTNKYLKVASKIYLAVAATNNGNGKAEERLTLRPVIKTLKVKLSLCTAQRHMGEQRYSSIHS
jgi:hypothetical protein